MGHIALGQRVLDEHGLDRLQIEFGRQIHHRQIFVVEIAVLVGRIAVALDQVLEKFPVRDMWRSRFIVMKPESCRKPG